MKTRKLLSLLLILATVVSMVATLTFSAGAAKTDVTSVYVGETEVRSQSFGEDATFSADEQDGNLWYFYTTDETILKVVDYYVEGKMLYISLKGIAVGDGVEILCKQYDEESTSWVEDVNCINGIFNVVPAPVYLDLDDNTTDIKESKDIDQFYSATVTTNKTDVTKVQVSWTIPVLSATVTQNKIWDTETLKWVDDTNNENTVTASDVTAVFDFVNLSSVKVNASVAFEAIENVDAAEKYTDNAETADAGDGKIVLDTANTDAATYDNTGKVQVKITADEDFFKALTESTAADTKYGKYTVTISEYKETAVCSHAKTASTYYDPLDISFYIGTHLYADADTVFDAEDKCFSCVPWYFNYNETTQEFGNSTSPKSHYETETEFADVTVMGWYYFNGTKFVRCADDEVHPNDEELPTTNAAVLANTHAVTVHYYANENDAELTSKTIRVSDGTSITTDGQTIYIGGNSFVTAKEADQWSLKTDLSAQLPSTVKGDMEIVPTLGC